MPNEGISKRLIEQLPDAVFVVDASGTIVLANSQAEVLFGWDRAELLGQPIEMLVPVEARAAHPTRRARYFQNARVRPMGAGLDLSGVRKDGTQFPAEISLSSIESEDGPLVTAAVRDVTERKAFEAVVARARDVAENAARSRQDFLANMSHEIRTPMNAIIGMTTLLLDTTMDHRQRDFVETLRTSGEHLLTIINDILDYAKIDAGKLLLEELPFSVRDWLADTLDLITVQARDRGLELLHDVAPDVPEIVLGDPARLRQILVNLLSNAVKFTHAGQVSVRIGTQNTQDGQELLTILVSDTGVGVAADRIDLLFEPFTQADSTTTRLYGGTGLGLAISRRLAEAMGGSMIMESTLDVGTTVGIEIPVARMHGPMLPIADGLPGGRPLVSVFDLPELRRQLSILIVEDTPVNQKVTQHLLARFGFRSDVAASAAEALVALEQRSYDLVLMDVQMPLMDGLEATRRVRSQWPGRGVQIIAMTANVGPEDVRRCYESGMDGFLPKPIEVESLANVLRALACDGPDVEEPNGPVDRAVLDLLCERIGRESVSEIADLFLADLDSAALLLAEGCRGQDRKVVAATAHRLKSGAHSLGAASLGELLNQLEQEAAGSDWVRLSDVVGQVERRRGEIRDRMLQILKA